jgi:hypothetical protein
MTGTGKHLLQVDFVSPEGRKERLWAEANDANQACILSVPVWIYGVSAGSIVRKEPGTINPEVIRLSPGATVRFLVSEGRSGKDVYLSRVVPDLRKLKLGVGPATFFGPRLVALHVHERETWWPEIGTYLDGLIEEGLIEQWEAGDPDQGAVAEIGAQHAHESVLEHPLPVDAPWATELG